MRLSLDRYAVAGDYATARPLFPYGVAITKLVQGGSADSLTYWSDVLLDGRRVVEESVLERPSATEEIIVGLPTRLTFTGRQRSCSSFSFGARCHLWNRA